MIVTPTILSSVALNWLSAKLYDGIEPKKAAVFGGVSGLVNLIACEILLTAVDIMKQQEVSRNIVSATYWGGFVSIIVITQFTTQWICKKLDYDVTSSDRNRFNVFTFMVTVGIFTQLKGARFY